MTKQIEGMTIKLGGDDYIVPALTIGQVKRLRNDIQNINIAEDGQITEGMISAAAKVVHAALSRNYPDVTIEQVEDMIDLRNIRPIIDAVMGISGFKQAGEAMGETGQ